MDKNLVEQDDDLHGPLWSLAHELLSKIAHPRLRPFRRAWQQWNIRQLDITVCRISPKSWPQSAAPLCILHLSDPHFSAETDVYHLLSRLRGCRCDIVVITGDLIQDNCGIAQAERFLRELRSLARLGVFVILGNHDYIHYHYVRRHDGPIEEREGSNDVDALCMAITRSGATLLRNESVALPLLADDIPGAQNTIHIVGLDDPYTGHDDLAVAFAHVPESAPTIVLSHTPDRLPQAAAQGATLYLAGHTHGGQVCLPFIGALTTSAHSSLRYPSGYARYGQTHAYVSRGLGTATVPLRAGCHAEATLLILSPAETTAQRFSVSSPIEAHRAQPDDSTKSVEIDWTVTASEQHRLERAG